MADQKQRLKIGLALGGGGAKGAAHIGVIRVLEEMNIPVDYVAGTSIGAYVAGMVAMGLSADEIEQLMFTTNWTSGYSDKIARSDLSYRNKKIRDKFQIETDVGFDGSKVSLPSGYIQGETMAVLLRQSTKNLRNFNDFDDMPVPLRTVALDLGAMLPYVFDRGNLVTAMQASMAVPGALKPIEHDGKILADGGIVNNLPVDVLKDMGADIVIAIDIGTDLSQQSELDSYLAIAGQLITHMTNTSTRQQIANMTERDILIKPEVSHIGTGDFGRVEEGLPLGEKAARLAMPQLTALSLSENDYNNYVSKKMQRRADLSQSDSFIADRIEIISNTRLDKSIIRRALGVKKGVPYSQAELEENIHRIYAQNLYERVDYEFEQRGDDNVLVVYAKEKSWGPGFFDMMISVEESFNNGSSNIAIGGAYTLTDINRYGAEWRSEFIVGTRTDINTEFYSPLDKNQNFYWNIEAGYTKQKRNFYFNDLSENNLDYIATEFNSFYTETELGWNINPKAIAALGYGAVLGNIDLLGLGQDTDTNSYGPYLRFGYDTLDNIYFPTRGHSVQFKASSIFEDDTKNSDDSVYGSFKWLGAHSIYRHSLALNFEFGGTDSSLLLPTVAQDLGGYRKLSGFNQNEISGRYKAFGALLYNYRLAENDFGAFAFPTYIGLSLERGNVWNNSDDIDLSDTISAGSLSIGVASNIGPIILSYGKTNTGEESVYMFLGTIF